MRPPRPLSILLAAAASCAPTTPPRTTAPPAPRLSATTPPAAPARSRFDYPLAKRTNDADVIHGVTVPDPYRWLEADDSDDERQWFEREDARARREIGKLVSTKSLIDPMNALYNDPLPPLPTRRKDLAFLREGNAIVVRDDKARSPSRTIFDASALPSGVRMTAFVPSVDGTLMTVETSRNGADMRSLRVVDVKTGQGLEELQGLEGSEVVWAKAGFFYAFTPPDVPHADRWASRDIRFHEIGKPQSTDRVVIPASADKNASSSMNALAVTSDGARLLVRTFGNWEKQTFAIVELTKPKEAPIAIEGANDTAVVEDVVFAVTRSSDGSHEIRRLRARGTRWELVGRAGPQLLSVEALGATLVLTYSATTADTASGWFGPRSRRASSLRVMRGGDWSSARNGTSGSTSQPAELDRRSSCVPRRASPAGLRHARSNVDARLVARRNVRRRSGDAAPRSSERRHEHHAPRRHGALPHLRARRCQRVWRPGRCR